MKLGESREPLPALPDWERLVEDLMHAAWEWGDSCGVDDVAFDEQGDSHNEALRAECDRAKDRLYAALAQLSPLDLTDEPVAWASSAGLGRIDELEWIPAWRSRETLEEHGCSDAVPLYAHQAVDALKPLGHQSGGGNSE